MMLILGMDPGSLSFGVGVVEKEKRDIRFVHAETLRLAGGDINKRMHKLWESLGRLLQAYPVREAAMEEGFLGKNVHSLSLLSMVRGVALAALIARGVPLRSYSPRQVKLTLTGYGQAGKPQVERMVAKLLKIPGPLHSSDESDALAVAYCHAMSLA